MAYPNWETPLQGLIAQQQNPLTNLSTPVPQQAQPGFMDQFQGFTQTPQGQQALLAFANAALQNNMNPMMGGGAGFIGAMGSGMQGYKAADEYQERKARQKKTEDYEDQRRPLEIQHLQGEIAAQGKTDTAYKIGQIVDWGDYDKGGVTHRVKKQFLGLNPDKSEKWKVVEDVTDKATPKEPAKLTKADIQMAAMGAIKLPGIDQKQAQEMLAKDPDEQEQRAWQAAMNDKRGWAMTAGDASRQIALKNDWKMRLFPGSSTTPARQDAAPAGPIKKVYNPATGKME